MKKQLLIQTALTVTALLNGVANAASSLDQLKAETGNTNILLANTVIASPVNADDNNQAAAKFFGIYSLVSGTDACMPEIQMESAKLSNTNPSANLNISVLPAGSGNMAQIIGINLGLLRTKNEDPMTGRTWTTYSKATLSGNKLVYLRGDNALFLKGDIKKVELTETGAKLQFGELKYGSEKIYTTCEYKRK